MIFQDARDYQILFLSTFLFLGISTRDWTLRSDLILTVIVSCLMTQLLMSLFLTFAKNKNELNKLFNHLDSRFYYQVKNEIISSLRSALITSLGLCLLLRANDYRTMAIAGCLAIASKFIFCFRAKHFFNPANFGIICALIFSNDAWISPGQWGTDWWYLALFLCTGGTVLKKVGRWDTSIAFLLTYGGLEAIRNVWLGWTWDVWQHQFMSGSLLLFSFFMITDPRSIPNAKIARLLWAMTIALITFILRDYYYVSTAMLWALFIISPLTLLFDYLWSAPRFDWRSNLISTKNIHFNLS